MAARLQAILTFKKFKSYIEADPNNKRAADLPGKKYKEYVLFTEKAEKKFFKLMSQFVENDKFLSEMHMYKSDIFEYQEDVHDEAHSGAVGDKRK